MTPFQCVFIYLDRKDHLFPKKLFLKNDDTQYRQYRLFLPIPITTDYSNSRPDYAYSHYIGTALVCFII